MNCSTPERATAPSEKPYEAPQLTVHGSLAAITHGTTVNSTSDGDGLTGS